jgi:tetratricopeptide (TPR) repeat protein
LEKYFLTGFLFYLFISLLSCSNSSAYLNVIEGKYAFSRGEYQEANLSYLNVKDNELYRDYISYNLGNVYYALGEIDSAFTEWQSTEDNIVNEIKIRTFFNEGVLLFELSRFEESYEIFRKILELEPSNINAKINLEYSIQKMNFTTENRIDISESSFERLQETDNVSRVLDFVKRRETNLWKSTLEYSPESPNSKDW